MAATILFAVARAKRLRLVRLTLRETLLLLALATTGLVLFNVCVIQATRHASPALVGTVVGVVPVVLALVGPVLAGPMALVIEGEIGIGKTALWKHGLTAATNRSHRVLACRPIDAEAQLAYAALGDLLAEVREEALAELPGPQRRAVEVALLRAEPEEQRSLPRAVAFVTQEPESTFCWTTSFSPPLCAQPVPRWPRSPSRAVSSMTRGLHSSKATAPAGTSGQPITAPPP